MTSGPYTPYTYTWTPAQPLRSRVHTSPQELVQISGAFAVLTLDFLLILYFGGIFYGPGILAVLPLWEAVAVAATSSLTAFVAHEMAHKVSAQRGGYWAEFRWAPLWLAFSVFTSYLGFLFAAPGATVVGGMGNPRDWARTSLAGPLVNMVFAVGFYAGSLAAWSSGSLVYFPLLVIAFFNGWFGAFNLIPLGPLDGAKVLHWSTTTWLAAFAVAAAVAGVCFVGLVYFGRPVL
jgi:Zn-dependent protease